MIPEALRQALDDTSGRRDIQWAQRSVLLINESWGELALSRHGGHLLHFAPRGQQDWLWTGSTPKAPPGAIRGGIPLCWPWFGDREDGQGPAHGTARTADWMIEAVDDSEDGVEIHLFPEQRLDEQLSPRLVIHANARRLALELMTEHDGETPTRLTQALHSYFDVTSTGACRVEGLSGARYIDKLDSFSEHDQVGELGIRGGLDRIYHSSRPLVLDDGQRRLRIAKNGSDSSVVWHPGTPPPGDVVAGELDRFLCVEAACTQLDPVWLAPGAQHRLSMHVSLADE
ncbi:glucose-6-phosphate 1-epimerase [Kushneria sinocarnis]|uniref:Putative glucose-6-phosphate 1-epimerase n=1 Tax=Kushneria sinocarnis TaxID=595502 RepID=A0A420WX66_9GAMM|nr:D-hexose-6-phosphate mutarotase [Kushneria sinocarnis]RKR04325.1 glucose-6-phosphate 1-epimerase [Kushneria sinocarnis]